MAPHIVFLVLLVQTLQLAGGLSVTQTGPPVMVSLANEKVKFGCSITYQYQPQNLQVSYFYTDLQGHNSSLEDTECRPGRGIENQTSTFLCTITPKLHSAKATGTYYCSVLRGSQSAKGKGTFILVRDSGYQEPPEVSQKILLFCSLGILLVLSVLGTAALLWRKVCSAGGPHPRWCVGRKGDTSPLLQPCHCAPQKLAKFLQNPPTRKYWDPRSASSSQQPATTDSIYTDLQRQDTQVYSCLQSPTPSQNLLPQEKARGLESDSDGQLVYENL